MIIKLLQISLLLPNVMTMPNKTWLDIWPVFGSQPMIY